MLPHIVPTSQVLDKGGQKRRAKLTASTDSMSEAGRLKKNLDRSNTPSVVLNLCALLAFSRTGKNTWSAFAAASVCNCGPRWKIAHCVTYALTGPVGASTHSHWTRRAVPRAFRHAKLEMHDIIRSNGRFLIHFSSPSVDALTATNLSKLSSTRTRIASERISMELRR